MQFHNDFLWVGKTPFSSIARGNRPTCRKSPRRFKAIQRIFGNWEMSTGARQIGTFIRKRLLGVRSRQLWPPNLTRGPFAIGDDAEDIVPDPIHLQGGIRPAVPKSQRICGDIQLAPQRLQGAFTQQRWEIRSRRKRRKGAIPTVISAAKRTSPPRPPPNLKSAAARYVDTFGKPCPPKRELWFAKYLKRNKIAAVPVSRATTQSSRAQRN